MDDCRVIDLVRDDDINIVGQNSNLRQAAERLLLSDCELLAVTDERGKLAGIVSESSIVRGLLNSASGEMHLSLLTSHHAESVRSDLPVTQVLHLFRSSCHSAIPVVDEADGVCGLLRRRDVMQFLLSGRVDTAHTSRPAEIRRNDSASTEQTASRNESSRDTSPEGTAAARPWFLKGRAAKDRLMQPKSDRLPDSDSDLTGPRD